MTDRELLEAAARADGVVIIRSRLDDPLQRDMLIERRPEFQPCGWNPLADDGDALRLAVALAIRIEPMAHYCVAYVGSVCTQQFSERVIDGDRNAATRRAIVRAAAAEIG